MKLYLFMAFALLTAMPVHAQTATVSDTLDWHRYFPLSVGNTWEYNVSEGEPLLIHRIVGDSTVSGKDYFLMQRTSWDYDYVGGGDELEIWWRDTLFVRHSDLGGIVQVSSPEADTTEAPTNIPYGDGWMYFDLRTDFGDSVQVGDLDYEYYTARGGYGEAVTVNGALVTVPAVKTFIGFVIFASYAADVGLISSGNLWGPRLSYALVSGVEYGVSRDPAMHVGVERPEQSSSLVDVYPNPVLDVVSVDLGGRIPGWKSIVVVDIQGRVVQKLRTTGDRVNVDLRDRAPGLYMIRITGENGVVRNASVMRAGR